MGDDEEEDDARSGVSRSDRIKINHLLLPRINLPSFFDGKKEFCWLQCTECRSKVRCRALNDVAQDLNKARGRHAKECPAVVKKKEFLESLSARGLLSSYDPRVPNTNVAPPSHAQQLRIQSTVLGSFYRVFRSSTFFENLIELNSTSALNQCLVADLKNCAEFIRLTRRLDPTAPSAVNAAPLPPPHPAPPPPPPAPVLAPFSVPEAFPPLPSALPPAPAPALPPLLPLPPSLPLALPPAPAPAPVEAPTDILADFDSDEFRQILEMARSSMSEIDSFSDDAPNDKKRKREDWWLV